MTLDGAALFRLLPAVYRVRDAEQGDVLARLMDVLAEQVQIVREDLAQLYDNQFIETCADWVVPYIGASIGYRQLHGVTPAISSPRAEVANTIGHRRGKGTLRVLERLARDVTGWDAHVVESFLQLAVTQSLKHVRAGRGGTVDLRDQPALDRIDGPFDRSAHTAEVRGLAAGGRWNIPNVAIHVWSLESAPLSFAKSFGLDGRRFFFNPLGIDTPLYNGRKVVDDDGPPASESDLPVPITRRALDADFAAFYGLERSLFIEGLVASWTLRAADLSDLDAAGTEWAHVPAADTVLIDPELGRFVMPSETPAARGVWYRHADPGELGGGEYERAETMIAGLRTVPVNKNVDGVPDTGIGIALGEVEAGGAAEFGSSDTWHETPVAALDANVVIELRAADQTRPLLRMDGTFEISGADGSELTINGLVIAGGALHVAKTHDGQSIRRIRLVHCTLVPGLTLATDGSAKSPGTPSLVVETDGTVVELDHCIVGALRVAPLCSLSLTQCIVDAGAPHAVALAAVDGQAAGASLQATDTTVIGRVHSTGIEAASNCIFHAAAPVPPDAWPAPVWSERRQEGCLRFSYVPLDALVPRRYRCQPTTADDAVRVTPMFASMRYGDSGYLHLCRRTASELRIGADDGSEMGVYRDQLSQQKDDNLRLRLDEYLRVGLAAGLIHVD